MPILTGNAEPSFFKPKCSMMSSEGYTSQFKEEYNCSITDAGFKVQGLKDPFGNTSRALRG